MKKVYNQSLGGYILVDPITRQPLTQGGEGIFDVFSKIGSKIASKVATESSRKVASKTAKKEATSALDSGAKALGQKVGEKVVEKITPVLNLAQLPASGQSKAPNLLQPQLLLPNPV